MNRNVGLDFGTTNSTLSYFDTTTNRVESYRFGGAGGQDYVPSFLSIDKRDKSYAIGIDAKNNQNTHHDIFSKFKILMDIKDKKVLTSLGYTGSNTPRLIAKEYIRLLIEQYKTEQNIKDINSIVVTVPEIWLLQNMESRQILMEILRDELKLPLKELISEPMAVSAYFLHQIQQANENFNGHLLVFDYGGGTLDITLMELKDEELKVLERMGSGNSDSNLGSAGVAFDEKVVQMAYKKKLGYEATRNTEQFRALTLAFENTKIASSLTVERAISRYLRVKMDDTIFSFTAKGNGDFDITPSLLIEAFGDFKQNIHSKLKNIQKFCESKNIDTSSSNKNFKIVMVGGFSNFYLSRLAVQEFFNCQAPCLNDPRFANVLNLADKSLAISKGAALIVKDKIRFKKTHPIGISLHYFNLTTRQDARWEFITRGTDINYEPIYYPQTFIQEGEIRLSYDLGNNARIDNTPLTINNLLFPKEGFKIGFSVNMNEFISMYIKDTQSGKETKYDLDILLTQFKDRLIARG